MKRPICVWILVALFSTSSLISQEKVPEFGIKLSGFVKNDFFWDSRQTVAAREGHFLLWPSPELLDINNVDINKSPSFNFLSVQSRISAGITGPDAFGAKTTGLIEGDFFAQLNDNINLLRLRHAIIKLNWKKTELLTGQFWNPLFVTDCFPATISFNTGTPLQAFSRNPQIRLTHNFGTVKLIAAALSQRDYSSRGPDPSDNSKTIVSNDFLRNSAIPDLHFQLHYKSGVNDAGASIDAGAGAAFKTLVPRLYSPVTGGKNNVDEKVSSISALAFTKITLTTLTIKLYGRYGQNNADVLSTSGFAVKNVEDIITGRQSYTPLQDLSFWAEVHSNGKKVQAGILGGYLKNLGTLDPMSDPGNPVYGLATNIASLYRISPRVVFISNKTKLGFEIEYTTAAYGSNHDENYIPQTITPVSNLRGLMSVIYSF